MSWARQQVARGLQSIFAELKILIRETFTDYGAKCCPLKNYADGGLSAAAEMTPCQDCPTRRGMRRAQR